MNLTVDLQIATEDDDHPPPADFEQWVNAALTHPQQTTSLNEAELSIRIVENAEITQLNHEYRGKNNATNVLSFPAELPDHIDLPLLGDLVICAEIVTNEACEQHKPNRDHWAHMVVHGTLHLLGYDHIDDSEAELMEALEIEILSGLNIANPYLPTHSNKTANL